MCFGSQPASDHTQASLENILTLSLHRNSFAFITFTPACCQPARAIRPVITVGHLPGDTRVGAEHDELQGQEGGSRLARDSRRSEGLNAFHEQTLRPANATPMSFPTVAELSLLVI